MLTKKMIVQAAAKGFAWESGTEALQSLIAQGSEIGLSGVDMDNVNWAERGMRLLNEYLAGGVGGGTMSTGLTALEYRKQQKVTAEPARQPGTEIDDEDASPAGGPPSNNEPQAAGSSAAAQATQPAGAPARTTEEAGKPAVPAEGATVTVVDATTPASAIAAAAAGTGTPAIPEDEDAEPAAAGRPGEPEEFTDIQRQRAADWARQRTAVDPALAAALQPTETKADSTQGAGAPATIGAPQPTTTPTAAAPVETAPLPLTTVDTGGQAQGTPPAPALAASAAPVTQPLAAAEATPAPPVNIPTPQFEQPLPPQTTTEVPAGGIAPAEEPLEPAPDWSIENDAQAVAVADKLGLTEQIGDMARQGLTAKQISEALGGRLDRNQVRAVRDSLGIERAGPLGLPGGAELPVAEGVAAPRPAEAAPEAIAGKAPAAQPTAEAAPAAAPEARKPQRSAISRQLGDETRLEVKRRAAELRTEVADHPELNQIIDEVADELTQKVKKGEPPAKTVKRLLDKAVEQVRGKALLRAHEKTIETHDVAVEQHAKAEQIAEERELGKSVEPTAGQQKRRRGKAKGEVPAEVAETLSEKAMEARYQENQEDPDLKAWHAAHEKRKKVKGKGSALAIKAKRSQHTEKMEEAKTRYVERLKEEGRTIAARKEEARKIREEQEEEKHADEASQTVGERQAQVTEEERKEEAEQKAKQKKAEAKAESTPQQDPACGQGGARRGRHPDRPHCRRQGQGGDVHPPLHRRHPDSDQEARTAAGRAAPRQPADAGRKPFDLRQGAAARRHQEDREGTQAPRLRPHRVVHRADPAALRPAAGHPGGDRPDERGQHLGGETRSNRVDNTSHQPEDNRRGGIRAVAGYPASAQRGCPGQGGRRADRADPAAVIHHRGEAAAEDDQAAAQGRRSQAARRHHLQSDPPHARAVADAHGR